MILRTIAILFVLAFVQVALGTMPSWRRDEAAPTLSIDFRDVNRACGEGVPQTITVDFEKRRLEVICNGRVAFVAVSSPRLSFHAGPGPTLR